MVNFIGNKSLVSPVTKYFILTLFFLQVCIPFTVFGQLNPFVLEYSNIHKNTYTFNKVITLATNDGDLKKAEANIALLDKENKLQYHIANAYLQYNLYGKAKGHDYLEDQPLSDEWKFYCKVYLAHITKNWEDRDAYYKEFNELFRHSDLRLYLETKFFVDYINDNIWNEDEEQLNDLLRAIDKRLTVDQEKEQLLILELLKLELQKDGLLDFPEEEQQLTLIRLWKEYGTWMDPTYLVQEIEDCEHPECLQAIKEIQGSVDLPNDEEVFAILNHLSNNDELEASEIKQSEQQLSLLFSKETDLNKRELLKAMTFAASDQVGLGLEGFEAMLLGDFGELTFSEPFINQLTPIQSKDQLMTEMKQSSFYKQFPEEAKTEIEQATAKELFFALGFIQYAQIWARLIEDELGLMVPDDPTLEDFQSWTNMKSFLDKNPFYYDDTNIIWNLGYPKIESKQELETAIQVLDELLIKYPGCTALHLTKNTLVIIHWDFLKDDPDNYYRLLFQSVFDLFAVNQYEGSERDNAVGVSLYLDRGFNDSLVDDYHYIDAIFKLMSPKLKSSLEEELSQLMVKHPLNINFKELNLYFEE